MAKADKSFSFDEVKDELTDQQRLFCMEYVTTFFNGTKAAINAGYAKESATEQASRLLTKDKVKDLVAIYKSDVGAMLGLSAYHVANMLWEWVDSDITETFSLSPEQLKEMPRPLRRLITQYKTTTVTNDYGQTTTIELKFVSKERAMEMLKQMLGYDKPAKIANTDSEGKDVAQLNIIAPVGLKLQFPNNTDGATT
jgi:phage terminase small subunit